MEAIQPLLANLLASPPQSRSSENLRAASPAASPAPGGGSGRSLSKSLPATPKHRGARGSGDFIASSSPVDFPEHCLLFDGHMKVILFSYEQMYYEILYLLYELHGGGGLMCGQMMYRIRK
jgi:hypothetical protein